MKTFKGKAIYNPQGKAGEYAKWACNFYTGCSNGCEYCYCKSILRGIWTDKPRLKSCFKDCIHAMEIFEKELRANLDDIREHGLFFSFTTDPMISDTVDLTYEALELCYELKVPVKLLTKCTDYLFYLQVNKTYRHRASIAVGFTLTGHDELEPGASKNAFRIKAMRLLHKMGFKIWASIEPVIDFPSAKNMINATMYFCDLYKIGLKSGGKYDVVEAQGFVEWLNELQKPKIYLKESLQKLSRYTNSELDEYFVERDYNIFKNQ